MVSVGPASLLPPSFFLKVPPTLSTSHLPSSLSLLRSPCFSYVLSLSRSSFLFSSFADFLSFFVSACSPIMHPLKSSRLPALPPSFPPSLPPSLPFSVKISYVSVSLSVGN